MLVFIAALRRELRPLESSVQVRHRAHRGGCAVALGTAEGSPVALVQTGIGREQAQAGARLALEEWQPRAVVAIGFAGGVSPGVKGGDLVLAERVFCLQAPLPQSGLPADSALLEAGALALAGAGVRVHRGGLLTAPTALGPEMKRWAGSRFPICAVDMESYWIGEAMGERGVPFLAVRAAFDEVGDWLPEYERFLDPKGQLRPIHASSYLLRNPRRAVRMAGLVPKARRAAGALGAFGGLFLQTLRAAASGVHG